MGFLRNRSLNGTPFETNRHASAGGDPTAVSSLTANSRFSRSWSRDVSQPPMPAPSNRTSVSSAREPQEPHDDDHEGESMFRIHGRIVASSPPGGNTGDRFVCTAELPRGVARQKGGRVQCSLNHEAHRAEARLFRKSRASYWSRPPDRVLMPAERKESGATSDERFDVKFHAAANWASLRTCHPGRRGFWPPHRHVAGGRLPTPGIAPDQSVGVSIRQIRSTRDVVGPTTTGRRFADGPRVVWASLQPLSRTRWRRSRDGDAVPIPQSSQFPDQQVPPAEHRQRRARAGGPGRGPGPRHPGDVDAVVSAIC